MSTLNGLLTAILSLFVPKRASSSGSVSGTSAGRATLRTPMRAPAGSGAGAGAGAGSGSGSGSGSGAGPLQTAVAGVQTVEVDPSRTAVRIAYAPNQDGDPDAGEIVWTWVPYAENDGRGKDRPVLVVGRCDPLRVYAVRLTSKSHDGDRDFLSIGSGPWDPQRRESWVDIDQLYVVHHDGMRREASALDLDAFTRVAAALQKRWGWRTV